MAKKPDPEAASKKPAKAEPAKPAAVAPKAPPPGVDPRRSVAAVLDAEIAHLRAQVAGLEKRGADAATIEPVRNRLRLRAIQRAKLG